MHLGAKLGKMSLLVQQGIVLGRSISSKGIAVDTAKIDIILKLPPPMTTNGV